ncbi:MAG: LLM class F420-dependent oxidoreductase [Actinobacteria bacterium]|nr:LLM class F420-dependent oxidoreductase [Actinomycetota bacterium]
MADRFGSGRRSAPIARLGVDLPAEAPIAARVEFAQWAESQGFDDAWTPEISDPDAFVLLAAVAAATSGIRVGTGIVPLGTRTAPLLAAAAASVAEVADGRFALGVGVSSRAIIEGWHGVSYDRPLERVRQTLPLLRGVLAGERTDIEESQVKSKGFRLRRPPQSPPPLLLAAMNEKMIETAGALADGVLLNLVPPHALPTVLAALDRGAEGAARKELPEVVMAIACEITDDPADARARFAQYLSFYLTAPAYRKALTWYGFGDQVAAAERAYEAGGVKAIVEVVGDDLIDAIALFGDVDYVRARLVDYGEKGIDAISVFAFGQDPMATLTQLTRDAWPSRGEATG